jgi:hypothetical protein
MRIGGTLYHDRTPDGGAETSPLFKHPTFLPKTFSENPLFPGVERQVAFVISRMRADMARQHGSPVQIDILLVLADSDFVTHQKSKCCAKLGGRN